MNILAMLAGNPAAATSYNPGLSPEANAFVGARPAAPKVETFQRPKGLRNTIGQIADALAVLGGQTPAYSTALSQQEATFVKKQKENALGAYLANPTDPEAQRQFQTVAPAEYVEVLTKLTPKPQNPGSRSPFQVAYDDALAAGMTPQQAQAEGIRVARAIGVQPRYLSGAGDQYAVGPDGQPTPLGIGVNRAPPAPPTPSFAPQVLANGNIGAFDQRTGQIVDTGVPAAPKGGAKPAAASSDPAKGGALGSTIDDIRKDYRNLNAVGGMVSPKKGVIANIRARAASSDVGQVVAGTLGTEAQTIRDRLASNLPALMQQVKQATGMTAAQVNSIPEMRLLQDQVTNPTRSFEAVMSTLDDIEKRYLGGGRPKAPSQQGNVIRFDAQGRRIK